MTPQHSSEAEKHNSLCIRLTESAVFIHSTPLSRESTDLEPIPHEALPGIVRGLLVLNLVKPTKISSIDITLSGKSTTSWVDGSGLRKYDVYETNTFYSSSHIIFKAMEPLRRTSSISPVRSIADGRETPRRREINLEIDDGMSPFRSPYSSGFNTPTTSSSARPPSLDARGRKRAKRMSLSTELRNSLTSLLTPKPHSEHPPLYENVATCASTPGSPSVSVSRHHFLQLGLADHKGEGVYKEFHSGTYTYPISIPIPVDEPATVACSHGGITWQLKATVHRPGTFTNKLSAKRRIRVVRNPFDDEILVRNSNAIFERQWENQLKYSISFSNKLLYIGATIPLQITFYPLEKVKIYKLSASIEESTKYYNKADKLVREETRSIVLLSIEGCERSQPILPLVSDEVDAFKQSPLYAATSSVGDLESQNDVSELASSFMGPGPWTIRTQFQIPDNCSIIQHSHPVKKGKIIISHQLKFILRVQRGNETQTNKKTGNLLSYDIAVTSPIELLSCRCDPRWTGLPPYTDSTSLAAAEAAAGLCPCSITHHGYRVRPRESRQLGWEIVAPVPEDLVSRSTIEVDEETRNILYRDNTQFERLVSGAEGVTGEVPPSYRESTRTPSLAGVEAAVA